MVSIINSCIAAGATRCSKFNPIEYSKVFIPWNITRTPKDDAILFSGSTIQTPPANEVSLLLPPENCDSFHGYCNILVLKSLPTHSPFSVQLRVERFYLLAEEYNNNSPWIHVWLNRFYGSRGITVAYQRFHCPFPAAFAARLNDTRSIPCHIVAESVL